MFYSIECTNVRLQKKPKTFLSISSALMIALYYEFIIAMTTCTEPYIYSKNVMLCKNMWLQLWTLPRYWIVIFDTLSILSSLFTTPFSISKLKWAIPVSVLYPRSHSCWTSLARHPTFAASTLDLYSHPLCLGPAWDTCANWTTQSPSELFCFLSGSANDKQTALVRMHQYTQNRALRESRPARTQTGGTRHDTCRNTRVTLWLRWHHSGW